MTDELLSDRIERLENAVEGLHSLPAAVADLGQRVGVVETQNVQLRDEMHSEFSAVRSEMRGEIDGLRIEMREGFAAMRDDMLVGLANVTSELGRQIRDTADESRRHARVLFEETLSRIAALGEQRQGPSGS